MPVIAHCINNGFRTIVLPVKRIHIPLHTMISCGISCLHNIVVIIPIWWSEKLHFNTSKLLHLIMYLLNLFTTFRSRQLAHLLMILAMVTKIMPCRSYCLNILRKTGYPSTGHKKSYPYIVLCKDIQNIPGILIAPGKHSIWTNIIKEI